MWNETNYSKHSINRILRRFVYIDSASIVVISIKQDASDYTEARTKNRLKTQRLE